MFDFLKNHPFAVEAFFESSIVLTFAVPKSELQDKIPACLQLDTFNDTWAFVAVAMVQTKDLRPKGFPKIFGNDFFLIGYRIFVRYINADGKRLRGLYILQSQTDKKKMELLGNIFTRYSYTTIDIARSNVGGVMSLCSTLGGFEIEIDTSGSGISLPQASPFADWKEARKFAGPLPFTFTFNPGSKQVLIIEGVRESWVPRPVTVVQQNFRFLHQFPVKSMQLANAFIIEKIPYSWKKGKLEKWKEA